ncbi:hypothetical protein F5148DRAFT_194177 [Russula earlei]|uniref:Uncharacterized protein n=1 Tax=Russula earlei TaxID=71964 RepID=A0ACC0U6B3_9AGAM|nr:hypothetical protein F5148DRAFT_194177 [Russula earlei]
MQQATSTTSEDVFWSHSDPADFFAPPLQADAPSADSFDTEFHNVDFDWHFQQLDNLLSTLQVAAPVIPTPSTIYSTYSSHEGTSDYSGLSDSSPTRPVIPGVYSMSSSTPTTLYSHGLSSSDYSTADLAPTHPLAHGAFNTAVSANSSHQDIAATRPVMHAVLNTTASSHQEIAPAPPAMHGVHNTSNSDIDIFFNFPPSFGSLPSSPAIRPTMEQSGYGASDLYGFSIDPVPGSQPHQQRNSHTLIIGEQPNPFRLLHPEDSMSRHRGAEEPGAPQQPAIPIPPANLLVQVTPATQTDESRPKRFPCPICSFSSDRKHNLKTHIREVHDKERPYACETCDHRFTRKHDLGRHVSMHGDQNAHRNLPAHPAQV